MEELKPFHFIIRYDHEEYECDLIPASPSENGFPDEHKLYINRAPKGVIRYLSGKWICDQLGNERLADAIGEEITQHYNGRDIEKLKP